MKKAIHILVVGHTFDAIRSTLGDFDGWVRAAMGATPLPVRVVDVPAGDPLPDVGRSIGMIITGSHAMVTDDLPWSLAVEQRLPRAVDAGVPVLGICYGHQLLARALGGRVNYRAAGREIGTVPIELGDEAVSDPLFEGLPRTILGHTTHAQSVTALPTGAVRLAGSAADPHHAFRYGDMAWGVQFHPEFDARIMRSYISQQAEDPRVAGVDVARLLDGVRDTPLATGILRRFVQCLGPASA